ncbi:MAG: hypothetical protein CM1200mP18_13060 [Gammaproteobacteria bacterium]|nr:MAG: hypothetical protein CM1200mP18_13060 [Gammaproteobacteria bacterium]
MIDLTGKTTLVTGGSRGIGAATVRQLVSQGEQRSCSLRFQPYRGTGTRWEFSELRFYLCQADLTSESETEASGIMP